MSKKDPQISRLLAHVCADEVRTSLTGVYLDPAGIAVATDGLRLYMTRSVPCDPAFAGKIVDAAAYGVGAYRAVTDVTFPDYRQALPRNYAVCVRYTVPKFVAKLNKRSENAIYIDARDGLVIQLNNAPEAMRPEGKVYPQVSRAVCLDLALLAPYAGDTVFFGISDSHSPVAVVGDPRALVDLTAESVPWGGIVMPFRGSHRAEIVPVEA